jgi:hypothetical protein
MEEAETTSEDPVATVVVVDTVEAVAEEAASAVATAIVEAAEVVEVTEVAEVAMAVATTIVEVAEAEASEAVVAIKKEIAIATVTPEEIPGVVEIRLGELDQVQLEVMTTKEGEALIRKIQAEEATALAADSAHPTHQRAEQALTQLLSLTQTRTILQAMEECVVDKDSEEAVEEAALMSLIQPVLQEASARFT